MNIHPTRRRLPVALLTLACAGLAACGIGCDRSATSPAVSPDQQAEQAQRPATRGAQSNSIAIGDPLAPIRNRAEAGEVQAMITLGRAHESLGGQENLAQAREWYQKASATGDDDAKLALKMLDATAAPSASPPPFSPPAGLGNVPPGAPAAAAGAPTSAQPSTAPTAAAGRTNTTGGASETSGAGAGGATTAAASKDLTKLAWAELLAAVDTGDFVTDSRPAYRKHPADPPRFIGISTAPDKTMTIAASGPNLNELAEVSIVMRVRNVQDVPRNARVAQAQVLTQTVTRNNLSPGEVGEWIAAYISSGVKSDPVFRNGWRITVTGPAGEGIRDPKSHLGHAVLVEMKK